ncbi:MAG TPA: ankyrin repeat domain-containing protein [Planctomycetaceae bacterium]|nr:ankyrin repeat domain-containing protein [Planctomycetaceae bacterium]
MKHYTEKQLRAQDNLNKIFSAWQHSKNTEIISQLLMEVHETERLMVLEDLMWIALEATEWELASYCVSAGISINAESDELLDCESIRKTMENFGDRADIVEWLLKNGAEIDCRGWLNHTPLMYASKKGYSDTVKTLVSNGADVNAYSEIDGGCSPLMAARSGGHGGIAKLLIENGAKE